MNETTLAVLMIVALSVTILGLLLSIWHMHKCLHEQRVAIRSLELSTTELRVNLGRFLTDMASMSDELKQTRNLLQFLTQK